MSAFDIYREPAGALLGETVRLARLLDLDEAELFDDLRMAELVEEGLPAATVASMATLLEIRGAEVIVPETTLRRARLRGARIPRLYSDRLYELSRVVDAVSRFYRGDRAMVISFLKRHHPLLGGRTPLDMAISSSAGARAVLAMMEEAEAGFAA